MAHYRYQCLECGEFSRIVDFKDRNNVVCPTCGRTVLLSFGSPLDCVVTETPDKYKNKPVEKINDILEMVYLRDSGCRPPSRIADSKGNSWEGRVKNGK